ncbi:MAG: prepilin-type N-terminal cleavage/methylation domain-containing protein [Phycisphaeraceae bacterium]|nr:prepilin-type N-terminal cleavage/methylation domain-containing protein [Phycisphaeraceae bacterium]MBX3367229.1 prepilin-type N-terminal cleavage/methylation domain-containing protein [Phycisphaeraceae bacterium]QYK49420.1 MAG: prepilin-type N-terminal cleavage/methylation domain-containing protein [Phycisphaeraceae bacterium]
MPRSGFSLLETMVVVAIIAILSAVAVPMVASRAEMKEAAACADVAGLLRTARALAMATGDVCGVSIDRSKGVIEIVVSAKAEHGLDAIEAASGAGTGTVLLSSVYGGAAVTEVGGAVSDGGREYIWFGHDGVPRRAGAAGIVIGIAEHDALIEIGEAARVRVYAYSGAIE